MVSLPDAPLRILVASRHGAHADAIPAALARPDGAESDAIEIIHELEALLMRLDGGGIDVLLLSLDLADSHGIETLDRVTAVTRDVPVIVFGQDIDEDLGIQAIRRGAQDVLSAEDLRGTTLRKSIRYSLERHRLMTALRSLSLIDELTGLYNRRGFQSLGEQYLKLARRSGKGAGLVYVDLDRLAAINDSFGHRAGDQALVQTGEVLRSTFRGSDLVARMADDDFAVLAQNSQESPAALVERVKEAFAHYNEASLDPYTLHVSVGAARTDGAAYVSLDELVSDADVAMHEDKRRKRPITSS